MNLKLKDGKVEIWKDDGIFLNISMFQSFNLSMFFCSISIPQKAIQIKI